MRLMVFTAWPAKYPSSPPTPSVLRTTVNGVMSALLRAWRHTKC